MDTVTYPNGEPCRVGDIVWLDEGRHLGRVVAAGCTLRVERGLCGSTWGGADCPPESARRLTSTELLAMELLFQHLGMQLGKSLWNNPAWHTDARMRHHGNERVWELVLAPQDAPERVQSHIVDRRALHLPESPEAPEAGARRVQADGVIYHEGDWLWEHGGSGVRASLLQTIIHPGDEDWQWFYEQEAEMQEDYVPEVMLETAGLDGRSGFYTSPESCIEGEWCGKLSETERLAIELLFLQLRQHPGAHKRGWKSCRNRVELGMAPECSYDSSVHWEYQYNQWTLTLSFCSPWEGDSHVHAHRRFRFNREGGDFTFLEESTFLTGGGIKPGFRERLRRAFLRLFMR